MVPIGRVRVLPPDGARVRFLPGAPQTRRGFDSCLRHHSAVGFLTPRSLLGIGTPIRSSTLHLATQWISVVPIGRVRVLPPDGARVRFLPGAPQRRWFPHPPIPVRDRDPHQVLDPSPCHPMDQRGADWQSPRAPTRRGEGSIPAWGTDSAVGFLTPRSLFGIGTPLRSSTLHLATQWISMVPIGTVRVLPPDGARVRFLPGAPQRR